MGRKYPVDAMLSAIRDRHDVSTRMASYAFCRAFYDLFDREPLVGDKVAQRHVEKLMARVEFHLDLS